MAATNGALNADDQVTGSWLTNAELDQVIGYPAAPIYPGPITSDHADPGQPDPGRSGPPSGDTPDLPVSPVPGPDLSGGTISDDVVSELGYSAPIAAFDSSAGDPFAPSGPIADTHGYDTGGTERKQHVPIPHNPGWWRRTLTGETTNRTVTYDPTGKMINDPAGRENLDLYQGQNANGWDPFQIPYSERPIQANFAREAYPIQDATGVYTPEGALPDMAPFGGQGNTAYTAPPDPVINTQPSVAEPAALGMEYLNG